MEGYIGDYNAMFGTNFSTRDTDSFYGYYRDIAKKVKERKVDILLVVNMFLTGFDCKTLNTLYVDKNLRFHGLVQAYSRTNRILNEVKSQGNIVVFRNLKKRTDEAIALFSNMKAKEEIFIPPYEDYVKHFNNVDFELELLHRDVINVQYILTLLARLYDADPAEAPQIRKLILDSLAGDIELRSKKELIEKFIEQHLPKLGDAAEIPEGFESFWEEERVTAFAALVKEEQLDPDKLAKVIDRYVYTGKAPLTHPDIVDLIRKPMGVMERGPTKKRVYERVLDYVATFIKGMAA